MLIVEWLPIWQKQICGLPFSHSHTLTHFYSLCLFVFIILFIFMWESCIMVNQRVILAICKNLEKRKKEEGRRDAERHAHDNFYFFLFILSFCFFDPISFKPYGLFFFLFFQFQFQFPFVYYFSKSCINYIQTCVISEIGFKNGSGTKSREVIRDTRMKG